jgi:molybdopterin molybdotransferase
VPLEDALQRVLAEEVQADRDYPPFARSMRDGYAILAQDALRVPKDLACIGEIKAGDMTSLELHSGEAIQIMTGAPVPPSADTVVMVESTERVSQETVRILKTPRRGDNVAPKGSECTATEQVLSPFRVIGPFTMAVLASVGKSRVQVVRKPSVAILSTGDELVEIEAVPGPTKIRNSNSSSLSAQVRRHGGIPVLLPTARDDVSALREQIQQGLESDILLVSGGVSAGKYDLVEPVLTELGINIHFESVSMRPGKPTVFATRDVKWVFGLPGNPVSTFVAFEMFVRPVLRTLQGVEFDTLPLIPAVLETEIVEKSGRTSFLPAKLFRKVAGFSVQPVKWRGSADIFSAAEANGLIIIPLEATRVRQGEVVEVLVFEEHNSQKEGVF